MLEHSLWRESAIYIKRIDSRTMYINSCNKRRYSLTDYENNLIKRCSGLKVSSL